MLAIRLPAILSGHPSGQNCQGAGKLLQERNALSPLKQWVGGWEPPSSPAASLTAVASPFLPVVYPEGLGIVHSGSEGKSESPL